MTIGKNFVKQLGLRPRPPARFQSGGGLSGLLSRVFRPGDPDGSKAAAASARSRQTEPLSPEQRLNNYAWQDGGYARITPARRRRILKSLRRAGMVEAAKTWAGWDRPAGQRRREGAGQGADSSRVVLNEASR